VSCLEDTEHNHADQKHGREIERNQILKLDHRLAIGSLDNNQHHKADSHRRNDIDRPTLFKSIDQDHDDKHIEQNIEISIPIVDASEIYHLV
jgi:hypothetical protein